MFIFFYIDDIAIPIRLISIHLASISWTHSTYLPRDTLGQLLVHSDHKQNIETPFLYYDQEVCVLDPMQTSSLSVA